MLVRIVVMPWSPEAGFGLGITLRESKKFPAWGLSSNIASIIRAVFRGTVRNGLGFFSCAFVVFVLCPHSH